MANYLLDTNAILYVLKTKLYRKINKNCHILELSFYEYGNAILNLLTKRKNGDLIPYESATTLLQAFEKIVGHATVVHLETGSMNQILEIAIKHRLTYYDASYLHCCSQFNYSLITEDEKLKVAALNNSVRVMNTEAWTNKSSSV